MGPSELALNLTLDLTLGIAAWTDWRKRKIYNKLLGPAFLIAISLQAAQQGWSGIWMSLTGSMVGLALLMIPYLKGGIGAGDVKLLGVIGAFGGVHFVVTGFLYGAVLGGIVSLVIMIRRHAFLALVIRLLQFLSQRLIFLMPLITYLKPLSDEQQIVLKEKFPYGLVLVAGTVMAYFIPLGW